MNRGLFIVFEGGEGAGKTTQVARLARAIASTGRTVVTTREPGGTTIGQYLRSLLLVHKIPAKAEALMYLADRAVHVAEVVEPSLALGSVVISDRFTDSTCIYQGLGRGLDPDRLREMSGWAAGGLVPDLVVVLDVDPRIGLARVQTSRGRRDQIEAEGLDFHDRVRAGFLDRARDCERLTAYQADDEGGPSPYATRYVVVDAAQDVDLVAAEVSSTVQRLLLDPARVA